MAVTFGKKRREEKLCKKTRTSDRNGSLGTKKKTADSDVLSELIIRPANQISQMCHHFAAAVPESAV